jgi:hypothetical protein
MTENDGIGPACGDNVSVCRSQRRNPYDRIESNAPTASNFEVESDAHESNGPNFDG